MENRGRKILIVDDNPEFIEMVRRLLEAEGFQTTVAISGQKAIEKVLSESPELVLLDLKLPDTSGEEVLRRIRDLNENISNIVITGYGGEQSAVELMKAGAMDFLSKPIERETLIRAVKDAFKIHDVQIDEKQKKNHSSLERFFPFLAHEIRNPLHAIGGALAIIQRRSNLKDEFLAKSIKIIQEEIHHLNDFVQDCLDFVRPPVKSRFIEVDINEIISVIINVMSHMFEESSGKIKIIAEIDSHLPKIYVNYEEVKQALLNIMKNSYESMTEKGELIIRTGLNSNPSPQHIEIIFIDNGLGIKKENMGNLFKPFFTTKNRGTGLGLALCRRIIVDRHHGNIHIESEEGKGTTVKVELPVSQPMGLFKEKER